MWEFLCFWWRVVWVWGMFLLCNVRQMMLSLPRTVCLRCGRAQRFSTSTPVSPVQIWISALDCYFLCFQSSVFNSAAAWIMKGAACTVCMLLCVTRMNVYHSQCAASPPRYLLAVTGNVWFDMSVTGVNFTHTIQLHTLIQLNFERVLLPRSLPAELNHGEPSDGGFHILITNKLSFFFRPCLTTRRSCNICARPNVKFSNKNTCEKFAMANKSRGYIMVV